MKTDCILHTGCTVANGYGLKAYKRKTYRAHRLAYALHHGRDPDLLGGVVLHTCDVRLCVNPEHLVLGTQQANMDDKVAKGRQAHGEGHGRALFTNEQVITIRSRFVKGCKLNGVRAIARDYGVDATVISELTRGLTYK